MPIYTFVPAYDRLFQAGWVINPFVGLIWEKLDEGPGWDAESIDHNAFSFGNNDTIFEVAFPDVTPTADALSHFGVPRIYGAQLLMRSSQIEASSFNTCKLAIFGSFGSGIPATPVDNSVIDTRGSPSEQTIAGPGFLEAVGAYRTPMSLHKNDGTDWTAADLNSAVAQVSARGQTRVYTIWLDVDIRLQPVTMAGVPAYPNQRVGMWQPISWRFNNAGDGIQKKYQVRIFTPAQWAAGGAGVGTDTKACQYDSGIVLSSKGYHDFTQRLGARRIRGVADGTYYAAIRTAKDWKGGDWWSEFWVSTMVIAVPGTVDITSPTLDAVLTTARPTFTATTTVATADIKGSEWVVFETPAGGFPEDFDPEITDLEPAWRGRVDGNALQARVDKEFSLNEGFYRLYVRFQEVDFSDWTDWVWEQFSVDIYRQAAPTLTMTPDYVNGKVGYVLDWKADANNYEAYEAHLIRKTDGLPDVRVRLDTPDRDHGLLNDSYFIPGTAFHNIYKANSTSYQVTNLDISTEVRPPDWASHPTTAIAARWDGFAGNWRSWLFLLRSDNKLELRWSTDGIASNTQVSSVALPSIPTGEFRWLRAQLNVASNYTVTFQYSSDGTSWTTLGTVFTGVGATSIFDTTSNKFIEVGSYDSGLSGLGPIYVREWRLRTGINALTNKIYFKAHDNLGTLGDSMLINGAGVVFHWHIAGDDWEIPFNKETTYEFKVRYLFENEDAWTWSLSSTAGPYTISKDQTWLVACDDPSLSRRVLTGAGYQSYDSAKVRSAGRAIGREMPIVQKSVGKGDTFTFGFTLIGEQAIEDFLAIIESGSKLVLKTPKRSWYVEVGGAYATRSRIYDSRSGDEDTRTVEVPFVEVGAY